MDEMMNVYKEFLLDSIANSSEISYMKEELGYWEVFDETVEIIRVEIRLYDYYEYGSMYDSAENINDVISSIIIEKWDEIKKENNIDISYKIIENVNGPHEIYLRNEGCIEIYAYKTNKII